MDFGRLVRLNASKKAALKKLPRARKAKKEKKK
jgi:hypothetical protein